MILGYCYCIYALFLILVFVWISWRHQHSACIVVVSTWIYERRSVAQRLNFKWPLTHQSNINLSFRGHVQIMSATFLGLFAISLPLVSYKSMQPPIIGQNLANPPSSQQTSYVHAPSHWIAAAYCWWKVLNEAYHRVESPHHFHLHNHLFHHIQHEGRCKPEFHFHTEAHLVCMTNYLKKSTRNCNFIFNETIKKILKLHWSCK